MKRKLWSPEDKYYATIFHEFPDSEDKINMKVRLKEADAKKVTKIIKKLPTNLSVDRTYQDMCFYRFRIYMEDYGHIKIIKNLVYFTKDNVLEILLDEENKVRDVILDNALYQDFDGCRDIFQTLYPRDMHLKKNKPKPIRIRTQRDLDKEKARKELNRKNMERSWF